MKILLLIALAFAQEKTQGDATKKAAADKEQILKMMTPPKKVDSPSPGIHLTGTCHDGNRVYVSSEPGYESCLAKGSQTPKLGDRPLPNMPVINLK